MRFVLARAVVSVLLLLGFVLLPLLTLWPALSGPFLFDDYPNLDALQVLQGEVTWSSLSDYLAAKSAGPTGRPLAMLSFLLNDTAWPSDPYSFKYTNILIHALNGLLVFWLAIRLVHMHTGMLSQRYLLLAALVAAFWVLNPYHLSSVAYVIQRMALLAATCVLAGLLLYISGRQAFLQGRIFQGYGLVWTGYGIGAGLGVLFKENAVLFVFLVPLVEWLLFTGKARPWLLRITVGVPALILLYILTSYFFTTSGAYTWFRDFSLAERLLSQTRALGYYLWRYLIPGISYVGVYADGFDKSTSLLQPLSTLGWLLVHSILIVSAAVLSRRAPLYAFGVLFFYAGHALESGPVPLELFFEHRNYLPSAFLLLGLFHLPVRPIMLGLISSLVLICGLLQHIQAGYWGNEQQLRAIAIMDNPDSERAVIAYAHYLEQQRDFAGALVVMRGFMHEHPSGMDIALNTVKMGCFLRADSEDDVAYLVASPEKYRGKADGMVQQLRDLSKWSHSGQCRTLRPEHLEAFLDNYVSAYPRDGEAMQAQYVARAHIAFHQRNYERFRASMLNALDEHANPSLALSVCSQITVFGGEQQGCECFQRYREASTTAPVKRTLMQRLLESGNGVPDEYEKELKAVCEIAGQDAGPI